MTQNSSTCIQISLKFQTDEQQSAVDTKISCRQTTRQAWNQQKYLFICSLFFAVDPCVNIWDICVHKMYELQLDCVVGSKILLNKCFPYDIKPLSLLIIVVVHHERGHWRLTALFSDTWWPRRKPNLKRTPAVCGITVAHMQNFFNFQIPLWMF